MGNKIQMIRDFFVEKLFSDNLTPSVFSLKSPVSLKREQGFLVKMIINFIL
jgi:hypothetical protein